LRIALAAHGVALLAMTSPWDRETLMPIIDLFDARANLSRLVEQVESGAETEIIIARNGKPVARLVPIAAPAKSEKRLGLLAGQFPVTSQEEFDAQNEPVSRLFREGA
jgi:prevent-host-death family protein